MKTKEFVRRVEALGYEVSYDWGTLYIKRNRFTILDLGNAENWDIDTDYPEFEGMGWNDKKELMTIVSEYMLTDLIEREEERRYRLKLDVPIMATKQAWSVYYLNKNKEAKMYRLGSDAASTSWQTIFTESEISQMDITGFEKVEVAE